MGWGQQKDEADRKQMAQNKKAHLNRVHQSLCPGNASRGLWMPLPDVVGGSWPLVAVSLQKPEGGIVSLRRKIIPVSLKTTWSNNVKDSTTPFLLIFSNHSEHSLFLVNHTWVFGQTKDLKLFRRSSSTSVFGISDGTHRVLWSYDL